MNTYTLPESAESPVPPYKATCFRNMIAFIRPSRFNCCRQPLSDIQLYWTGSCCLRQQIWWQTPPLHQSPAFLHSDGEFADRELVKFQKIQGICDCGVCIIAFALHVALGDDPQNVFFEQTQMCHHLLGCFQKLEPFPRKVTSIP